MSTARKKELRKQAIALRKEGKTYSEILSQVLVAKSTLSLWLHDVGLAKVQKQTLTAKKLAAGKRGGVSRRTDRILLTKELVDKAYKEIGSISDRELFLVGVTLYWAEGSKEKDNHPGSGVIFTNMDARTIVVFLRWLSLCKVPRKDIAFELIIHESYKDRLPAIISFWSNQTGYPKSSFKKIYFKKGTIFTKRTNTGEKYFGTLRVRPLASSSLLRQIQGWTNGIYEDINKRA